MRIFAALDLDPELRRKIATFMEGVKGCAPEARWVKPESLHVTLRFIGEQSHEEVENLKRQLAGIGGDAVTVGFRGHGFFPSARAPRVFWVGIKADRGLAGLATEVDQALLEIPREEHAFSPHLTLARDSGRSGSPMRQREDQLHSRFQVLQERLRAMGTLDFGTMTANAFFLYQSQLGPGGSKYTKLAAFPLSGRERESAPEESSGPTSS